MKSENNGINTDVPPSGEGCAECLAPGAWWLHLRRCMECGHVGCCDSSPSQQASKHFHATGHPIAASFEPGETWFYDYRSRKMIPGMRLAEPRWHPEDQPVPGTGGQSSTRRGVSAPLMPRRDAVPGGP